MKFGIHGLALIVFFVSIVVLLAKLISPSFLLRSVQKRSGWRPRDRAQLYRVTALVGSWSTLTSGAMADIEPGPGIIFFDGVVVITMIAARRFDPRLIWDNLEGEDG